jgi:hypothetical protein
MFRRGMETQGLQRWTRVEAGHGTQRLRRMRRQHRELLAKGAIARPVGRQLPVTRREPPQTGLHAKWRLDSGEIERHDAMMALK